MMSVSQGFFLYVSNEKFQIAGVRVVLYCARTQCTHMASNIFERRFGMLAWRKYLSFSLKMSMPEKTGLKGKKNRKKIPYG